MNATFVGAPDQVRPPPDAGPTPRGVPAGRGLTIGGGTNAILRRPVGRTVKERAARRSRVPDDASNHPHAQHRLLTGQSWQCQPTRGGKAPASTAVRISAARR
jgi:hypothetical protein